MSIRTITVVIAAVLIAAAAVWWRSEERIPIRFEPPAIETKQKLAEPPLPPIEYRSVQKPDDKIVRMTTRDGRVLGVHLDRLYDTSYDDDPVIQEIAKGIGIPPSCVRENFRIAEGMQDERSTFCIENTPEEVATIPYYEVQRTEFEQYSDQQLADLAPHELDATILLARRYADAGKVKEAQIYYERAMAMLVEEGTDPTMVRNEMKGRLP